MKGIANWTISLSLTVIVWLVFHYPRDDEKEENDQELLDQFSESCKTSSIDMYLHFFWIFACIYALSKFTELSERYLSAKIAFKERSSDMRVLNDEWEKTLKLYEQDKKQLDAQLEALREKNFGLEQSMRDLRDCNLHLISENFMRTVLQDQQIQGLAQQVQDQQASNIYITNRHIHLTHQVFHNEDPIDLKVRNAGGEDIQSPEHRLNVWLQYLKMRKCYMGPIADPKLVLHGAAPDDVMPIVMTTEQLAKLQGMV